MFPRIGGYATFGQPYDARIQDPTQFGSPYDAKMPDATQIGSPYDARMPNSLMPPVAPISGGVFSQPYDARLPDTTQIGAPYDARMMNPGTQPTPWSGTAQISPPSMMGQNPDLMYMQQQQRSYPFNRLYGPPAQPNYGYGSANPYGGLARLMQGYGNPRVRSF